MEDSRIENKESEQGEWLYLGNNPSYSPFDGSSPDLYQCSNCRYITESRMRYCPECGRKMS